MERKRFWEQSWLGLRALAVITVMLTTAGVGQAWAQGKTAYAELTDELDAEGNPGTDGVKETLTYKYGEFTPDNTTSWDVTDTGTSNPGWYDQRESIAKVVFDESFTVARPKNCYHWFYGCVNLTAITDLNSFNTSEVTNMNGMFNGCSSLTSLDISSFNTGNVTNMNKMFQACTNLMTIFASNNFTTGNLTSGSDMFKGCTKLVGGKGTTYNQTKTNYTYARLDGGSGNLGYFAEFEDLINLTLLNGVTTPTPLINNGHSYTTGTKITLSYTAPTGYTFGGFKAMKTSNGTDVTANVISESTLTMPNYPVTVIAKLYVENVPYMTWDDTKKKLVEATTPDGTPVHVLTGGGETTLPGGWYVAEGEVTYTSHLQFNGDAHLILADGCELTVGTEADLNSYAIYANECNLTIYGQGGETEGKLTATCTADDAIRAYSEASTASITINGGQVTVNGGDDAIYAYSEASTASVTINGGQVTATGDDNGYGIYADSNIGSASITINGGQVTATSPNRSGIRAEGFSSATVTITGGQVTATGDKGIFAGCSLGSSASITLGWTKSTDFIKAKSFMVADGEVKTAAGKRFVAYNMASEDDFSANYIIGSTTGETTLNNTDIDNIAGKTLRPLDGYLLSVPEGTVVSGKTVPDFTLSDTPHYIYKTGDNVTLTLADYGQDGVEVSGLPIDLAVTDRVPTIEFQMRNEDVNITAKYYIQNTGVDYLDWDYTEKKLVSKNTKDLSPAPKVYILTGGGATTLPGGWYVAEGEITYTGQLQFNGATHLILADGAEMSVDNQESGYAIKVSSDDAATLDIYGQAQGTGALTAKSVERAAIYLYVPNTVTTLTINGGKVSATPGNGQEGIFVETHNIGTASVTVNGGEVTAGGTIAIKSSSVSGNASVTINGGKVDANGDNYGIVVLSSNGTATATITGGKVEAFGDSEGIYAYAPLSTATITLGWTNSTDFIKASSYKVENGSVKIAAGKRFVAYNMASEGDISANCIIGSATSETTLNNTDIGNIAGKTLRPVAVANADGTTIPGYLLKDHIKSITIGDLGLTISSRTAPDFTISDKPYYIYKADDVVTLTTDKDYGQNGIEIMGDIGTAYTGDDIIADVTTEPGTLAQTATFDMPASDINISMVKYYNTAVEYLDWDDTQKKLVEKNTLTDGNAVNDKVWIFAGAHNSIINISFPTNCWYVVNNWNTTPDADGHSIDLAYNTTLQFEEGSTHFILADGCEMTAPTIWPGGTITIYGQSAGTGSLTATGTGEYGIYGDSNTSVTINGGHVTAAGSPNGIQVGGTITINGGQVTATGSTNGIWGSGITINDGQVTATGDSGIYAISNENTNITINGGQVKATGTAATDGYGIIAHLGNVAPSDPYTATITINGGQVTATGSENCYGIYAYAEYSDATITLGLTDATDYIKANSYFAKVESSGTGSVKIPAGKALACTIGEYTTVMGSTDATDYIFGAAGNTTLEYIAGQTLRPAKTLPVAGSASYVALYQDQGDWQVTDPDTKIYVPTGNIIKNGNAYEMELQEVTGGGIPDGKPVIVGKEGGLNGIPVRGTSTDEANTIETNYTAANPSPAFFVGDGTKTLNELIIAALGDGTDPADYIAFTLIGDKLVALDDSGADVKAGTCIFVISKLYVLQMVQGTYAPSAGARQRGIPFDLGGGTTGIDLMDNGEWIMDNYSTRWYDLQGRKLDTAPTQKGVYINRGKKVIIR